MEEFTIAKYLRNTQANPKIISDYKKRYALIKDRITSQWYLDKSNGCIVVALRIPSEKTNMVYYDVLFEFKGSSIDDTSRQLKSKPIRVFSNCPSFVYMNANLFKQKGWLITWAMPLYDSKTFPEEKESDGQKPKEIRYEKSLFFATMYMSSLNPITVMSNMKSAVGFSNAQLILAHIKNPQKTLKQRQTQVKIEKKIEVAEKKLGIHKTPRTKTIGKTGKSKHTNKIKHI